MLNSKERQHVLACFRYFCKIGQLPLEVNVDRWEIHAGRKSTWKQLACRVNIGIFLALTMHKNVTLAYAFLLAQDIPLYQIVIHMVLAASSGMICFWYYVIFIRYPETYAAFVRVTLTASVATGERRL